MTTSTETSAPKDASTAPNDIQTDAVGLLYEPLVGDARQRYITADAYQRATDPGATAEFLDRFLIAFCTYGVYMTEPVDRWIRQAGGRCEELGLTELGQALTRHAEHEAGHHTMMINDTRALVELWNGSDRSALNADQLLAEPPPAGCRRYIDLHEDTIRSEAPWGQLAIEYEIERLSITAGPQLMHNVLTVCGAERIAALSFLTDHIALDEGHTVFNRRQLNQLLAERPDLATSLGEAGSAALDAHGAFLADCVRVACLEAAL